MLNIAADLIGDNSINSRIDVMLLLCVFAILDANEYNLPYRNVLDSDGGTGMLHNRANQGYNPLKMSFGDAKEYQFGAS